MAVAMLAAGPIRARTTATTPATGIRQSLHNAIDNKRAADSVVDAISAEDMGAFPDQTIAESLRRVTGVQIQRDRGEGRDISNRSLDPKCAHVMLNGDGMMINLPVTHQGRS
ncbi:TonB-dependent receptor plug domain-containing protein [Caulobacter sp. 1776]|uniref:TonB-dependent receptor plug domain-containing protein n=1 Tax=Caulobacter sp. 1776 TaxID=3156420 RepID=UPI00339566E2